MTTQKAKRKPILFLDELSDYHSKDLSRFKPGAKILFGHIPPVTRNPILEFAELCPSSREAEVVEVKDIAFNVLHNIKHGNPKCDAPRTMIFYKIEGINDTCSYPTDRGIEPYAEGYYNPANFTVILSDLEYAGVEYVPVASPAYMEQIRKLNALIFKESAKRR